MGDLKNTAYGICDMGELADYVRHGIDKQGSIDPPPPTDGLPDKEILAGLAEVIAGLLTLISKKVETSGSDYVGRIADNEMLRDLLLAYTNIISKYK